MNPGRIAVEVGAAVEGVGAGFVVDGVWQQLFVQSGA
jgi:hypothetical protein